MKFLHNVIMTHQNIIILKLMTNISNFYHSKSPFEIQYLYWLNRDKITGVFADIIIRNNYTPNKVIYDIMVKDSGSWWSKEASKELNKRGIHKRCKSNDLCTITYNYPIIDMIRKIHRLMVIKDSC